jgi:hypothetical protein
VAHEYVIDHVKYRWFNEITYSRIDHIDGNISKEGPRLANGIDACLQEYGARSLYLLKNSVSTSKMDMIFLSRERSPTEAQYYLNPRSMLQLIMTCIRMMDLTTVMISHTITMAKDGKS